MKFFVCILIGLAGCTPRPHAPTLSEQEGKAVAQVDNIVISDQLLLDRIATIEKKYPRVYSTYVQKKNLLTEMMNIELLYREALRQGFDKRYEFKSRLTDLYIQDLAEKARAQIKEADIERFFNANKSNIERISARHILLKTERRMTKEQKAELRKRLEGYRAELLKDPEQFPKYAEKYSEDSTRTGGGELGYFTRSMMVAPFSEAAFRLQKIGDISPVVETQFGFHLIQLTGDQRGLQFYRELVTDELLKRTQRERLETELTRLKKDVKFQIYEDELAKLSPLPKEVLSDPDKLLRPDAVITPKK